uniref:Kinesin-like protein n=1 Tax=Xenopus tropicalis TaxID=8364 RepID=F7DUN3_XENTR
MKDRNKEFHYQPFTVALRIRPISEDEEDEEASVIAHKVGEQMVVLMDPTEAPDDILRANRSRERTFIFDGVFDKKATQEEVYVSTTKSLIEGVISGYNATVFAYGPTGTGKTYTMLGLDSEPGIYIRTLNDLFRAIEVSSNSLDYTVSMSYLEIYNEIIRDLLNPAGVLELREDAKGNIQIAGITEFSTSNAEEIMEFLRKGNKQRTQEPTAANRTSSRSHAVLQVTVKQKSKGKDINEEVCIGKLFMVDLAGSERASQTRHCGKRMKEGAHINLSLLALGNCINALSEKGGNRTHVNFRDSKLTRLLKDSLGGNSRTVMIAHISPASTSFEESRATLIYAYRAKNIKTRVKRNLQNVSYHIAQYTSIISDLRKEIEHLEEKIKQQEREKKAERTNVSNIQGGVLGKASSYSREQMSILREQLISAFKEQMEMRRSLLQLENTNIELHIDTSRHLITIADWEQDRARHDKKPGQKIKRDKTAENRLADSTDEENEEEDGSSPEPHEVTVAREEISMLLAEQIKNASLKAELEKRLSNTKLKASQLERLFPKQISSEEQQEVLRLLCRVHELEVENTELQAKALCKENLLCQKDFVILHYQQHRTLCDEIIQQQQTLIEDYKIHVPESLERLYQVHSLEVEKGTLNRLQQFQFVISNTLRDCLVSGESFQHPNIKQLEKAVAESRKSFHSQAKLELPLVRIKSNSDSKTSGSTPALLQTRPNSSVSPTTFNLLRTPTFQRQNTPAGKGNFPSLLSPNPLEAQRRHSLSVKGLSPELLEEIAVETKSISLVAARRRLRILRSESSFLVDERKSPTSLDPSPLMKKAVSNDNILAALQLKTEKSFFPSKFHRDHRTEIPIGRRYTKNRSRSFETIFPEISKPKPQNHHSNKLGILSYPKTTLAALNSKTFLKLKGAVTHPISVPTTAVFKPHLGQHSGRRDFIG